MAPRGVRWGSTQESMHMISRWRVPRVTSPVPERRQTSMGRWSSDDGTVGGHLLDLYAAVRPCQMSSA